LAAVRFYRHLYVQVWCAIVAGVVLGYVNPDLGAAMKPLGDGFIKIIRMLIAPIIFCTVVHGIVGMSDLTRVGRVALKALLYFEAVTTLALAVGLIVVNLWAPGAGMNVDPATIDTTTIQAYTAQARQQGVVEFLMHIIPATLVGAFAEGEILQVLFISVLFAFALALAGARAAPLVDAIAALSQVLFRIVGMVMRLAPAGAFGAMAYTIGAYGVASLWPLARLVAGFYAACLIFIVVVLGPLSHLAGCSLSKLIAYIKEELLIVLGTSSSESVLPRIMAKLERLGCEKSVVGLVIPTGYSFNLDGTCLYLVTATVFLAQATNTPLPLTRQLGIVAVLLLTSKGAAGVAGAAFVVLASTLSSIGTIPVASIALVLGIHRFMGEAMAMTNLVGNSVATIVIARWEGALDQEQLRRQLDDEPEPRRL
jgi:aerobic C4-dicarboxylate transport protein